MRTLRGEPGEMALLLGVPKNMQRKALETGISLLVGDHGEAVALPETLREM
jgi:hypothetical protein